MVFLSAQEIRKPASEVLPQVGGPDWERRLPGRIEFVTEALNREPLPLTSPVEERRGSGALRWIHRHYVLSVPPDRQADVEAKIAALSEVDTGLTVSSEDRPDGVDVNIGLDGLLTHTIQLNWARESVKPRVALLICSLGDDLRLAREFVALDAPIAVGVEPFRPFSKEVGELAHVFHREVWLSVAPGAEPNDATGGAVPVRSEDDLGRYLDAALASVPHVVGMTDADTETTNDRYRRGLMREAERRRLFYVGRESAPGEAGSVRAPAANARTVAVRDETRPASDQLAKLGSAAQDSGSVIGIGAPRVATPEALGQVLGRWRAAGIELVPVSDLAQPANLSAR